MPGCGWRESNPHGLPPRALPMSGVYQFRHTRTIVSMLAPLARTTRPRQRAIPLAGVNVIGIREPGGAKLRRTEQILSCSLTTRYDRPAGRDVKHRHTETLPRTVILREAVHPRVAPDAEVQVRPDVQDIARGVPLRMSEGAVDDPLLGSVEENEDASTRIVLAFPVPENYLEPGNHDSRSFRQSLDTLSAEPHRRRTFRWRIRCQRLGPQATPLALQQREGRGILARGSGHQRMNRQVAGPKQRDVGKSLSRPLRHETARAVHSIPEGRPLEVGRIQRPVCAERIGATGGVPRKPPL